MGRSRSDCGPPWLVHGLLTVPAHDLFSVCSALMDLLTRTRNWIRAPPQWPHSNVITSLKAQSRSESEISAPARGSAWMQPLVLLGAALHIPHPGKHDCVQQGREGTVCRAGREQDRAPSLYPGSTTRARPVGTGSLGSTS